MSHLREDYVRGDLCPLGLRPYPGVMSIFRSTMHRNHALDDDEEVCVVFWTYKTYALSLAVEHITPFHNTALAVSYDG